MAIWTLKLIKMVKIRVFGVKSGFLRSNLGFEGRNLGFGVEKWLLIWDSEFTPDFRPLLVHFNNFKICGLIYPIRLKQGTSRFDLFFINLKAPESSLPLKTGIRDQNLTFLGLNLGFWGHILGFWTTFSPLFGHFGTLFFWVLALLQVWKGQKWGPLLTPFWTPFWPFLDLFGPLLALILGNGYLDA